MAFKTMADNGIDISARQDGALYNVACGGADFIIKGIGDELAYTVSGLNVTVKTGEAVIHGRHVTAETTNVLKLPTNSSGYLVLRFDLSQTSGNEAYLYATPILTREEINWNGNIHDLAIASFTTTSTTATLLDERNILSNVSDNGFVTRTNISVSATPTPIGTFKDWDTEQLYGYQFAVVVNGITDKTLIENIVMTSQLLATVGYIVTTRPNELIFYAQTNDPISGTILTLITKEVN